MLVLTRKQNQEIHIGDHIKITVLKVKGNTVRLGIEAPREISVLRGELPSDRSTTAPTTATEAPQVAEFTVVFSNSDESQRAKVDVIPFHSDPPVDSTDKTRENPAHRKPAQMRGDRIESPHSVQFRGSLPAPLQHNRLQEIVNKLTANHGNSNV